MTRPYIQFTELFRSLSPYELNHFCEVMLCKIEESSGISYHKKTRPLLTEKDLQYALTNTMRDIAVELRQQEIDEQKALMFTNRIAA
jgi:hypothetical protein